MQKRTDCSIEYI